MEDASPPITVDYRLRSQPDMERVRYVSGEITEDAAAKLLWVIEDPPAKLKIAEDATAKLKITSIEDAAEPTIEDATAKLKITSIEDATDATRTLRMLWAGDQDAAEPTIEDATANASGASNVVSAESLGSSWERPADRNAVSVSSLGSSWEVHGSDSPLAAAANKKSIW